MIARLGATYRCPNCGNEVSGHTCGNEARGSKGPVVLFVPPRCGVCPDNPEMGMVGLLTPPTSPVPEGSQD